MSLYAPRTSQQILRDLLSKVIARTELSDTSVGSTLFTILNSVATEIATVESRLANIKKSYTFDRATGSDLDARVAELPPVGITRKRQTNAAGSVLKITRSNANITEALVIPAGSSVQRNDSGINYRIPNVVIIPAGETEIDNVYIVCSMPGKMGNALENTITIINQMPVDVISVTNTTALGNGLDAESDTSLRQRAQRYVNSLGRCSKSALEFLGTSFVSTNNTSFKFARVYEDPERNGYAELIVDDGSGLRSPSIRTIETQTFTISTSGARIIPLQRPSMLEFTPSSFTLKRNDVPVNILASDFIHIPERGVLFFKAGLLQAGDELTIKPFSIYVGHIAELQEEIEGNVNSPNILTGFRAAGTRVRVQPPLITDYKVDVRIIVKPGANIEQTRKQVVAAIVDFVNDNDIGKELAPSSIITHLMTTQNIASCNLFISDTNTVKATEYPASPKHVLRTKSSFIKVSTAY